ncbi:MAG TPA: recombinase family protein [Trebonia sp.]
MKAGIWLRVSTTDQSEEAQAPDCYAYAERQGYEINPECVYQVHGASARKGNRRFDDAWAKVLEDIKHGKIQVLIVWRLSRLDRKLAATRMINDVLDAGGRVEFAQQPHLNNLSTMGGRISLKVEEEIAFAESEEKSQRATASIALRKTQGKNTGRYPWGFLPERRENASGALVSTGALLTTDEGRKYVPFVFEKVIAGRAPGEIAAMLRVEGVLPDAHALFVRRMVANEKYRGTLVDPVTFDAAQSALASAPSRGRSAKDGERPLLTPLCGGCGGKMRPHFPPYRNLSYYRCYGLKVAGQQRKGCGARLVPLPEVNARVVGFFEDDESAHTEWRYIPGDNRDREIRELRDKAATLVRNGDFEAAMPLMAEAKELENKPRTEAGWREVPTGQTRAMWWKAASADERRAYLARFTFTVGRRADNVVTVVLGNAAAVRVKVPEPE